MGSSISVVQYEIYKNDPCKSIYVKLQEPNPYKEYNQYLISSKKIKPQHRPERK